MTQNTPQHFNSTHPQWQSILTVLFELLSSTKLTPTVKWGAPVYTLNGKNIIGIGAFNTYCGLWFYQGAQLKDNEKKLINAQPGKTKAMRQWRFNHINEVNAPLIKQYIDEAIELAHQGQYIKPEILDNTQPIVLPLLLKQSMAQDKTLKTAFERLTLGKQREYAQYIQDAKRQSTQLKRLEKIIPMVKQGLGLNDKYRSK